MSDLYQDVNVESLCADEDPSSPCPELKLEALKAQAPDSEPYIHRLPPKLVIDIFMLCIPERVMGLHLVVGRLIHIAHSQAIALAAVCVRWRCIAHSTPQLWTNFHLRLDSWYSNWRSFPPQDLIEEWLRRSRELPLSIYICANSVYRNLYTLNDTKAADRIAQILDLVKECSQRWESLICPAHILDRFTIDEELPQLRTLEINLIGREWSKYTCRLRPKRLTTLSTIGIRLVSVLEFNWDHITHLMLDYVLYSECVEAIRRAPRLVRCSFRCPRDARQDEVQFQLPGATVVHSTIQHIEFLEDHKLYQIVRHLSCPSLKTLVIEGECNGTAFDLRFILEFLRRSECSLEQLSLLSLDGQKMFSQSTVSITTFYEAIPTVQHLRLSWELWTLRPFLEPLTEFSFSTVLGRKQPRYLPSLRSLALEDYVFHEWQLLPDIFGTQRTTLPTMDCHRRLLQSVAVTATYRWISDQTSFFEVDEETLERLLWLKESVGVKWDIQIAGTKVEIMNDPPFDCFAHSAESSMNAVFSNLAIE